ncbi:MAG: Smr/MutS family protein [Flavobacteriaceae bacterium]
MSKFKLNDMVETVDDVVCGQVTGLDGDLVTIKTPDGFQMHYDADELMKVEVVSEMDNNTAENHYLKEKVLEQKKHRSPQKKKKIKNQPPMEVDLHIEKLISRPGQMSVNELLDYQLETAKRQLEFVIKKRISKVVFIHGVGAGVLRSELHTLFRKYPNLSYRDASFRKYGSGATEVLITYTK